MKYICINKDGTMFDYDNPITTRNIIKTLKTHTSLSIKHLYSWNYEDSIILCYGSIKGDAGDENKHELPPNGDKHLSIDNSDTQLLFGKIFIFRKSKSRFRDFNSSDYGLFYTLSFDGFDDCETSDNDEVDNDEENEEDEEDEDGENGEMNDFIVEDNCSDEDGDYIGELEEDENEY